MERRAKGGTNPDSDGDESASANRPHVAFIRGSILARFLEQIAPLHLLLGVARAWLLAVERTSEMDRAIRLVLLIGAMTLTASRPVMADCGLNTYPPFSGYGFDSDQCKISWQQLDWSRVIDSCSSDAQNAGADRHDFTGLAIAAQSWAKVAIAYDRMGQSELSSRARSRALSEIDAALNGFKNEKPTPDDENAQSASTLQTSISASNFYTSTGCGPWTGPARLFASSISTNAG
jgi:hypothetical protein